MRAHHLFGLRLFPLALAVIALEIVWFLLIQRRAYPWRDTAVSISLYALRLPLRLVTPLVLAPVALFAWSHRLETIPPDTVWGLALLFLGVEFAYYWMHRAGHEIRWMWASHIVHHTPEHIYFASALRIGTIEFLSGTWLFYVPLYFIGFHPLAVAGMLSLNLFYQFWLHTDLVGRLGPLEWIFNTPAHHRVHHASNDSYLDRNYGGILIVWDRLFGTFAQERPEIPIAYGLAHPIGSLNPLRIAFHEWGAMVRDVRRTQSWRERIRQLFGRPGENLVNVPTRAQGQIALIAAENPGLRSGRPSFLDPECPLGWGID